MLSRSGWFHKWRMYIPDVGVVSGGFKISYRDQTSAGETGQWMVFNKSIKWSPWLALINPQIGVSAYINQAAISFGKMRLNGQPVEESAYYSFFLSIMLQHQLPNETAKRQIRVEQITADDVFILMESEFISIV
ncbi:MAG: hypothetical protein Roseis2KO_07540 [Roseivirga sp.]